MTFVETSTVELKRTFTPSLKKEIVAFANSEGGTIYIGVEDDGNVIGVDIATEVSDAVNTMIHEAISPDLSMFAEAHVERFEDVDLVVVIVHRGPDRPYCIAGKGLRPEGVYIRFGTSAQPVSFEGIRRMLRDLGGESFENTRSLEQNLTFDQAQQVFTSRGLPFGESQLVSLGIKEPDGFYSNLGYLLSDQCPCTIKLARFSGRSKAIFQTRREFEGSLLKQVESALEMLDMLNNVHAEVDIHPERHEWKDYPGEALRETVMNAVVHRDYAIKASIGINVFDDRCEVISPGGLAPGATLEGALAGLSITRNSRLASLFYRLQWIEAYGTGIMKIVTSYEGSECEPIFEFLDGAVKVVLPNRNAAVAGLTCIMKKSGNNGAMSRDDHVVLNALSDEEYLSKQAVSERCGFSPTKTARILKTLVEHGFVVTRGVTRDRVYKRVSR